MLHSTVGVYLSGDYKVNGVPTENLVHHIHYNAFNRPGRALFVDGLCVVRGYLSIADVNEWQYRIQHGTEFIATQDTKPYQ